MGSGFIEKQNQNKKKSSQFQVFQNPWRPNFPIFQNQKTMGSRFTQGKKIRIKYLPVLGISKPLVTFSQNNQKRTGRFLGRSVLRLFQGFGEP
jgi:hypothetical protein